MNKKNLTSKFQQILFTVLFLTLLSGGTSIYLSDKENLSEQQKRIFETTTMTWNMGVGVIFGLLGGKATALTDSRENQ